MGREASGVHKNDISKLQEIETSTKRNDLKYINQTFRVGEVVEQLHTMMKEVVKGGHDAKNVNAACNCISQLNQVIGTTIEAAKFLGK